ncbi:MAG: radical SAM protein [Proteobacteria bacterium]|nr:MAG: radical SAM protein [Pseudomonadota bacterium]
MSEQKIIFNYVLLKLASRCNLKCTYCYWFKDDSVMKKPPILTKEAEQAFLVKLRKHIVEYDLKTFSILFHGGEPLMFGKQRFIDLCYELRKMEKELGLKLVLAITTNAVTVDDEWATILYYYGVAVTVSVDPTPESHNKFRVDLRKQGSYERTFRGFQKLRDFDLKPNALAVCDPDADADHVFLHFIDGLGLKSFDVLIPDVDHESEIPQISRFYRQFFDRWYDTYSYQGVQVRLFENIIKAMLGGRSRMESMGLGTLATHTLNTDGSLEAVDILRIAGDSHTQSKINIITHDFNDVVHDELWQEARDASNQIADVCKACRYKVACGGGHVAHRWSNENRYNNPSAYCGQLYEILSHIEERIFSDLSYKQVQSAEMTQ